MKRTFVAAFAAMLAFFAGCAGASSYCSEITDMWWNPRRIDEQFVTISVDHTGSRMTLVLADSADTCTYAGDYSQTGKLGQVAGTYGCAGQRAGYLRRL